MGNLCSTDETKEPSEEYQTPVNNKTSLGQEVEDNPVIRFHSIKEHLKNRKEKLLRAQKHFKEQAHAQAQVEELEKAYSTVLKIKQTDEFVLKTELLDNKLDRYVKEYEAGHMDDLRAMAVYMEVVNDVDRSRVPND